MKYLFFDIECAGVFKNVAKICAFGYCLTDEQFHILEMKDILINPKGNFHLTDRKGEKGLVLPYQYDEFKRYPTFPEVASEIYAMLQDEDTVVAGHATMNDVKYLNLETHRFSLPSFRFRFADTQFLYMNKIGVFSRQFGLGTIAQDLGVEFTPHRAVDDAYATMKIAEAMCKEAGCNLPSLIEKYGVTLGSIDNYEITQTTSTAHAAYQEEQLKQKEIREQNRAAFHQFVDKAKRNRNKNGKWAGKRICFSHPLEQQLELSKRLLLGALSMGCFYSFRAEESDYYVHFESENGQRLAAVKKTKTTAFTVEAFDEILKKAGACTD